MAFTKQTQSETDFDEESRPSGTFGKQEHSSGGFSKSSKASAGGTKQGFSEGSFDQTSKPGGTQTQQAKVEKDFTRVANPAGHTIWDFDLGVTDWDVPNDPDTCWDHKVAKGSIPRAAHSETDFTDQATPGGTLTKQSKPSGVWGRI